MEIIRLNSNPLRFSRDYSAKEIKIAVMVRDVTLDWLESPEEWF
jgi:hypothetical protein